MAEAPPKAQDFKNHSRVVPHYHIAVFLPLLANLVWTGYQLVQGISGATVMGVVLALALLFLFFSVRVQILTVQDRVIRLEMQLRLQRVLPAAMHADIARLTVPQLVALRFACDAELPALVTQVLAGTITAQKDIKQRVTEWQADFLRA